MDDDELCTGYCILIRVLIWITIEFVIVHDIAKYSSLHGLYTRRMDRLSFVNIWWRR